MNLSALKQNTHVSVLHQFQPLIAYFKSKCMFLIKMLFISVGLFILPTTALVVASYGKNTSNDEISILQIT